MHISSVEKLSEKDLAGHKLGADFHVKSRLIDLIISKIKAKFASMGKNKSFSRHIYLSLHKPNAVQLANSFQFRPMETYSVIKCAGTFITSIAKIFCGTTFSENVDHMRLLITQSYYCRSPVNEI